MSKLTSKEELKERLLEINARYEDGRYLVGNAMTQQLLRDFVQAVTPEKQEITEHDMTDDGYVDRMKKAGSNQTIDTIHKNVEEYLG